MKLLCSTLTALALLVGGPAGQTAQAHWQPGLHNTLHAITWGFCHHQYKECPAGEEAKQVSACETGDTFSIWADDGSDHLGLFQQGAYSRGFGHWAYNAWAQADSAYLAWKDNNFCWTCNSQWPTCGRGLDG